MLEKTAHTDSDEGYIENPNQGSIILENEVLDAEPSETDLVYCSANSAENNGNSQNHGVNDPCFWETLQDLKKVFRTKRKRPFFGERATMSVGPNN